MSKTKVEKSEYEDSDEEEECNGKCEDYCLMCLFKGEKVDMNTYDRAVDCFTEMRQCMDNNYMCIGTKLSSNDVMDFAEKINKIK